MYLEVNGRLINLSHVSLIKLDKEMKQIIFVMDYSIDLKLNDTFNGQYTKKVSDTIKVSESDLNFDAIKEGLVDFVKVDISKDYEETTYAYASLNKISSVKFDDYKNRVILNFSHIISITSKKHNIPVTTTSESVYINHNSSEEYTTFKNEITQKLINK